MKTIIKAHHIEITDSLKEYAEKKLVRIDKFFDHIQDIVIDLNITGAKNENEQQVASATVHASGAVIRASETSKDMYASIDVLYDKIEIQLKRHKEKLKDHKQGSTKRTFQSSHPSSKNGKRDYWAANEEKRYIPKPMGPEDAIARLEEYSLSFVVFKNMENHERISVVYPLGKEEYGIIET